MQSERLLQRFLEYVQIDTTARDDLPHYPSSPGQLELGRLLVDQLKAMGVDNAEQNEHGIVLATLPGNVPDAPTIAFNAHLDTSPETRGAGVQPQVIQNYPGGDIPLPADPSRVIEVRQNPELESLVGTTLITTDGRTLLGGDDKAGVAIIMELANTLLEEPDIPHGPVRLLFTCDEEIGRGTQHVDVPALGAIVCYTFDGGGRDQIDVETFSADLAVVTIRGINIHPSIAKDKMVNAVRVAGEFLSRLPRDLAPETTEDRQGFLHPYSMEGGVAEVQLRIILRSFETDELEVYAHRLQELASQVTEQFPGSSIHIEIRRQYRNMAEGLRREPRAVEYAVEAHRRLGREPQLTLVRGGTDGSQFTEKGMPTPNLSSGQHNIHSPLEFACLDEMVDATRVGLEILQVWAEKK